MRDTAQGHHLRVPRADENFVEGAWICLKFWIHLQNDAILVLGPIHDGDLTLAEGTVEGGIDDIGLNSQPASGIAVDDDVGLQTLKLLVAIDVNQLRRFFQLFDQAGCPGIRSSKSTLRKAYW